MSEIPNREEFVEAQQGQSQRNVFVYGVVVALFANKTAKITFDGEETASEKQYAYLGSYIPVIGDRVLLAATADTYIILGKVKFNSAPGGDGVFAAVTTTGLATLNSIEVTNSALIKKDLTVDANAYIKGSFQHLGGYLSFFNTQITTKKTCANIATNATLTTAVAKLNELIDALQAYGLIG